MIKGKVLIITGDQGEGKTTRLEQVIYQLKQKKCKLSGFIAPGRWVDDKRTGFDIVDINLGRRQLLCQDEYDEKYNKIGRFYFNPEAIKFGEQLLQFNKIHESEIVIIDEIGFTKVIEL